ncbi:MAG TPA: ParB N-terminal domain-containing protein [Dissulfurispiraceae bacterium]|nr:ParB N-terminal domain-containing protein [Dissulfurispiraceae bacterium]
MVTNAKKGQSVGRRGVPRLTNRLKVDDKFTPCPGEDGDEMYPNGIFEFNITKMIEYIQENPDGIILEEVRVSDFSKDFSSINESHMDSVDISQPVILAEISPGRYNLIDGNHRMEKAQRMGVEKIPAYKLNAEQHVRFLTSGRAYIAYVEYWNSKVKALKEQGSE